MPATPGNHARTQQTGPDPLKTRLIPGLPPATLTRPARKLDTGPRHQPVALQALEPDQRHIDPSRDGPRGCAVTLSNPTYPIATTAPGPQRRIAGQSMAQSMTERRFTTRVRASPLPVGGLL